MLTIAEVHVTSGTAHAIEVGGRSTKRKVTFFGSRRLKTYFPLRVFVEDSGGGVPESLRDRLFDRFSRADAGVGSGLGLAIARAYAQAMGGELFYRDDTPGARFELILPQENVSRDAA